MGGKYTVECMLRQFLNILPPFLRRQKLLTGLNKLGIASDDQMMEFDQQGKAFVNLRDSESRAVYLSHSFWPEFHIMVAAFLRNGGDMFDVGANFGLVSFGTAPMVKGTPFHLFEANPQIIPLLEKSKILHPDNRFTINHCCVTNEQGMSRLSLPDSCWGHGFIGEEGFEVKNLLLDQYIEEKKIKRIAFMKMDIEGFEPKAIDGAQRAFRDGVVEAAFIEVGIETLRRQGSNADKLLNLLRDSGFDLYFCGYWDYPDPHGLSWKRTDVNGTSLRFTPALPLPQTYVTGDVMAIHRTTPLSTKLKELFP
jgi:FkbM family methyltransferase